MESYMMLTRSELIFRPPANGTQHIRFGFVIYHGKNGEKDQISAISATLSKTALLNEMTLSLETDELRYNIEKGPLPTKNQIIKEMTDKMLQFERIKNVVRVFHTGFSAIEQENLKERAKISPGKKM